MLANLLAEDESNIGHQPVIFVVVADAIATHLR